MNGKYEKYRNGDYGYIPLTKYVDKYMVHSFNDDRKHLRNMIIIAADLWKKIKYQDLRTTKRKMVPIDMSTMTIRYPIDCLRVIGVEVEDECHHLHPLFEDGFYNTDQLEEPAKCGCKKCNCTNDGCAAINSFTYTEEDIEVGGVTYKKIIKARITPEGDIIQEVTEPYGIVTEAGSDVAWRTVNNIVEHVEVKECGCVVNTVENIQKCFGVCGWPADYCRKDCPPTLLPVTYGKGRYKNDEERRILHILDCKVTKAKLIYVSNGEECAEEIMIPEYAEDCLHHGLYWASLRFRSNISGSEKERARSDFDTEVQELVEFLNPILPHEFMELQNQFRKW